MDRRPQGGAEVRRASRKRTRRTTDPAAGATADRARQTRRRVRQLGLLLIQRGNTYTLHRSGAGVALTGSLGAVEKYIDELYEPRPPGPQRASTPAAWKPALDEYCRYLAGARSSPGHGARTCQRDQPHGPRIALCA